MTIARWAISVVLLLFGLYMAVMNWAVFVNNHLFRRKWTSAVPFVGGVVGVLGILLLPVTGSWRFVWIPLIADWGSVPVIVASLICARERALKEVGRRGNGSR